MGIVEQIKQRYRAEEALAYVGQQYSFALFFANSVAAEAENRIRTRLQELALRDDDVDPDLRIEVEEDCGNYRMYITDRQQTRKEYRFPRGSEQETALCWTVFGVTTSAPWSRILADADVYAELYQSDQQVLACALLKAATKWQTGVPAPGPILKEAVDKAVDGFVQQGPRLALQPVFPNAWEPGNVLFPRTRNMQERDFIAHLFGPGKFEEQIEAYCRYIRQTSDYREALDTAEGRVRKGLHSQPFAGLQNALHTAEEDLRSELSEELAERPSMRAQRTFSRLTPTIVGNLLQESDNWYTEYLKTRVSEVFLQDLLGKANEAINNEIRLARRAIQDMNGELRNFCMLSFSSEIPLLNLSWDQSVELQNRALQIPHTVWEVATLQQLQLSGSIADFWLMSQSTADKTQEQFRASSYAIPTLSDQTVIRLWKK